MKNSWSKTASLRSLWSGSGWNREKNEPHSAQTDYASNCNNVIKKGGMWGEAPDSICTKDRKVLGTIVIIIHQRHRAFKPGTAIYEMAGKILRRKNNEQSN